MVDLPKTIYVKREKSDGECYLVASEDIEDLLDKGEKTTVVVYERREYMSAGLMVTRQHLKNG